MKFGEFLKNNREEEWKDCYIRYKEADNMIKELSQADLMTPEQSRITSLSVLQNENSGTRTLSHADFISFMDGEIVRINGFTEGVVGDIREILAETERLLARSLDAAQIEVLRQRVIGASERFLRLEKYVNINFTGFHKILKKHDRHLPSRACKSYFIAKLHQQPWIRGNHSDVIVNLSKIFSLLRGDRPPPRVDSAKQDFVRSTTKYWVRTEDVSRVKCILLEHLPVFLQDNMKGDSDAQLVNSVYLDNDRMELYHGRLNKTPGAIALRLRWYGGAQPDTVFVERKTHRESWTGELSVKERFTVREVEVMPLLHGQFDREGHRAKLLAKKTSAADLAEWEGLVTEVLTALNSKQLVPTMRTQYMRTAFQIPFDARVRVSLDTNLTMVVEGGDHSRWFRDPSLPVPKSEITRFPHAVLEVKLQLDSEEDTPAWVTELVDSGMLVRVHKFSKFIHGAAVLKFDDVAEMPYWVDDESLQRSIADSASKFLAAGAGAGGGGRQRTEFAHIMPIKPPEGAVAVGHVLRGGGATDTAAAVAAAAGGRRAKDSGAAPVPASAPAGEGAGAGLRTRGRDGSTGVAAQAQRQGRAAAAASSAVVTPSSSSLASADDERTALLSRPGYGSIGASEGKDSSEPASGEEVKSPGEHGGAPFSSLIDCLLPCLAVGEEAAAVGKRVVIPMKVEPKIYFANERTFLAWLNMAVMLSTLAIAILTFADESELAQLYGVLLLPVAVAFMVYALRLFKWRAGKIRDRYSGHFDDLVGPTVLCVMLMIALTINLCFNVMHLIETAA